MESIIKRLRKELGLTQSQFADALNITAATVSRIESGKAPLTDRMLPHQGFAAEKAGAGAGRRGGRDALLRDDDCVDSVCIQGVGHRHR